MINIIDDGAKPFVVDIMELPQTLVEVARVHKDDPNLINAVKDIEGTFASFLMNLAEADYNQTRDEPVEHKDESENDDEGLIFFVPVGIGVIKIKDNE